MAVYEVRHLQIEHCVKIADDLHGCDKKFGGTNGLRERRGGFKVAYEVNEARAPFKPCLDAHHHERADDYQYDSKNKTGYYHLVYLSTMWW